MSKLKFINFKYEFGYVNYSSIKLVFKTNKNIYTFGKLEE